MTVTSQPHSRAVAAVSQPRPRVLEAYGFEPRVDGGEVSLANCPFHALAQDYTELV